MIQDNQSMMPPQHPSHYYEHEENHLLAWRIQGTIQKASTVNNAIIILMPDIAVLLRSNAEENMLCPNNHHQHPPTWPKEHVGTLRSHRRAFRPVFQLPSLVGRSPKHTLSATPCFQQPHKLSRQEEYHVPTTANQTAINQAL